jgi:hypothetical protein
MVTGTKFQKSVQNSTQDRPKKELAICACGKLDPKCRGYCLECVKKLKTRFDDVVKKYEAT